MTPQIKCNVCPACNKVGSIPSVNKKEDVVSCTTKGCRVLRYLN